VWVCDRVWCPSVAYGIAGGYNVRKLVTLCGVSETFGVMDFTR
jgi:hypothetical protein